MKCTLSNTSASIFTKVIHSFSRIGQELYLEAIPDGLILSTVNSTKSAFATMKFTNKFFQSYSLKSGDDENRCKLAMNLCVDAFKTMRDIESIVLSLNTDTSKLSIEFKCKLQTSKKNNLPIISQETLQAMYATDNVPNIIVGEHKLFTTILSSFSTREEELSLSATSKNIVARNYVEGTPVDPRFVRSQLTLKPEEFIQYKIGESTNITFRMRGLRAILTFAESMNLDIAVHFETAGKPAAFVISTYEMELNLVLATLSPEDEEELRLEMTNLTNPNVHLIDSSDIPDDSMENRRSKRNLNINQESEVSVDASTATENPSEIIIDPVVRKKRRTNENGTRKTIAVPIDKSDKTSNLPSATNIDLESEEVQVIFQNESDEISLPMENRLDNDSFLLKRPPAAKHRDHRPIVRRVFAPCFTDASSDDDSTDIVLAGCSDEE